MKNLVSLSSPQLSAVLPAAIGGIINEQFSFEDTISEALLALVALQTIQSLHAVHRQQQEAAARLS